MHLWIGHDHYMLVKIELLLADRAAIYQKVLYIGPWRRLIMILKKLAYEASFLNRFALNAVSMLWLVIILYTERCNQWRRFKLLVQLEKFSAIFWNQMPI